MRFKGLILFLMVAICFASCRRVDLHTATSSVYIGIETDTTPRLTVPEYFDVDSSPEMYARVYGPEIPIYRVCVYDTETKDFVAEDFLPAEGGFLNIPPGTYDMIIYSSGSSVTYVDDDYSRWHIYAGTNAEETSSGLMIPEPEHIFTALLEEVEIPIYSTSSSIREMKVKTSKVLESYSIQFTDIADIERVETAEIRISSQVPGRYLWGERTKDLSGSVRFNPVVDKENGRIYAVFNTFGRNTYRQNKVLATLVVVDVNGRIHQWTADITDWIESFDNVRKEIIIDNEIKVPDTTDGGGLNPDVDDWDDNEIYVPIS